MSSRALAVVVLVVSLGGLARFAAAQERQEGAPPLPLDPAISARVRQAEATRRTAREAGAKDAAVWLAERTQRAARHRAELAELWGSVSGTLDGQARLRRHADRMARLNRMLDLAQQQPNEKLVQRIQADIRRELSLFDAAMQALRAGGAQ